MRSDSCEGILHALVSSPGSVPLSTNSISSFTSGSFPCTLTNDSGGSTLPSVPGAWSSILTSANASPSSPWSAEILYDSSLWISGELAWDCVLTSATIVELRDDTRTSSFAIPTTGAGKNELRDRASVFIFSLPALIHNVNLLDTTAIHSRQPHGMFTCRIGGLQHRLDVCEDCYDTTVEVMVKMGDSPHHSKGLWYHSVSWLYSGHCWHKQLGVVSCRTVPAQLQCLVWMSQFLTLTHVENLG